MRPKLLSIFWTLPLGNARAAVTAVIIPLTFALVFSGCGDGRPPDKTSPVTDERAPFLGDLDKKMSEIYSKDNEDVLDPCDVKNRDIILTISRELEARRSKIEESTKAHVQESHENYQQFGPFQFRKPDPLPAAKDEWVVDTLGWPEVITYFNEIKGSTDIEAWRRLNSAARAVAPSDEDRLLSRYFMGKSRTSGPILESSFAALQACEMDAACVSPKLTAEQTAFLNNSGTFPLYLKAFADPKTEVSAKKKYIQRMTSLLKQHVEYFKMRVYKHARVEDKSLIVPLDLSVFGAGEADVKAWIEQVWNVDPEYKIRVEPVKAEPSIFVLKVSDDPGGRAYVDRQHFLMQLYNFGKMKSIAHEFGHILGFADYYYTTWNPKTCNYDIESNSGNIMSESTPGQVLPEHWTTLKKTYWPEQTTKN